MGKDDNHRIDILLAAYEGEKYLAAQLDSILAQTYKNIRIIIRDDASKDTTPNIIKIYQERYPDKILCVEGRERIGVKANFSKLMDQSSSPYVMFSDQDDIWMPEKIEKSLKLMLAMESKYAKIQPLLIHTDLSVVNEKLKILHDSFWKYTNLKPIQEETLTRLLCQNVVTGCTMMANRLLIELAKPMPAEAFMHDWWIALAAATFGEIGVIDEPTIYYRQHGKNALGAQKFGSVNHIISNFRKLMNKDVRKYQQAETFYHRYHDLFDAEQIKILKEFLALQHKTWMKKRLSICKHGFFKQGFLRNIADFIFG